MLAGVAALTLLSGTIATETDTGDLPHVFIAACLDGQAKLSPADAHAVSFEALPDKLKRTLGHPASAQVWKLDGPGDEFLYIVDYSGQRSYNQRVCGAASNRLDLHAAADEIEKRVTGDVYPKSSGLVQWTDPTGGYTTYVTKAGDFGVLQVNWFSDKVRRRVVELYRPFQ